MNPTVDPAGAEAPAAGRKLEVGVGLVLLAAGAGVVLLAMTGVWIAGSLALPGFPRVDVELTGADVSVLARASAFVALAGVVAVLATRGIGRVVVGAIVTAAGGAVFVSVLLFFPTRRTTLDSRLQRILDEPTMSLTATQVRDDWIWPYVALVGGALIIAGGVLVMVRGRTWPAMGRRYDAPARGGASTANRTGGDPWTALDRGEDPTR